MAVTTTDEKNPTSGNDGSCNHDSTCHTAVVLNAKALISEAISEIFDVNKFMSSSKSYNIADLGCSVSPNTFIAVKNIIESVELKCKFHGLESVVIEFLVFFNNHVSNDFNTLFQSLPCDRQYFVAGVPGSFHGRLFPKASLHFVNSSYSLQWLSKVPKEVIDKESPAWNKGRIYYTNAPNEVVDAYSAQFARDMESFLNARAEELVCGGLMAFVIPCLPVGTPPSQSPLIAVVDLLGASLMDLINTGLVTEDKLDSFNFPKYDPTPQELEKMIDKNGCFSIEKMEPLVRGPASYETSAEIHMFMLRLRASWEGLIKEHFGSEIIDELFVQFTKKVANSAVLSQCSSRTFVELFVLLRRKAAT